MPPTPPTDDTSFDVLAFLQNVILFMLIVVNACKAMDHVTHADKIGTYSSAFMSGVSAAYLIFRVKRNKY